MKKPRQEPKHGHIKVFYALVYDRNLHKYILVPVDRYELLKGTIRLP